MPGRNQLYGWWYVCIGAGFALLALRTYIAGARPFQIVLRGVVAAAFVVLGVATIKAANRKS